jgi:hypothetical protein
MFVQVNVITDVVVILNLVKTGEPASRCAKTSHTSLSANVIKILVEEFVKFRLSSLAQRTVQGLSQISIQYKQPTGINSRCTVI